MPGHTYKHIEITGSSAESSDDAIRCAIKEAARTLDHLHWFEVSGCRGVIEDGEVKHWQVTLTIGFRLNR